MNIVIKDGGNALKISKNTANITLEWFNSNGIVTGKQIGRAHV